MGGRRIAETEFTIGNHCLLTCGSADGLAIAAGAFPAAGADSDVLRG
jgi:hypothetical protein